MIQPAQLTRAAFSPRLNVSRSHRYPPKQTANTATGNSQEISLAISVGEQAV